MISTIKDKIQDSNSIIFFQAIVLTIIGIIALFSISLHQNESLLQTSFFNQIISLAISIFVFLIVLYIPRQVYHKYAYVLYVVVLIAIITPFFLSPTAGTYRWISLGGFGFQPSELSKWVVILVLAKYLSDWNLNVGRIQTFAMSFLIVLVPALIVFKQPDLGTALIMITPVIPMLYWVGARPFHLFLIIAPFISIITAFHSISFTIWAILFLIIIFLSKPKILLSVSIYFGNIFLGLLSPILWNMLHPYQQKRILTVFNPELDPLGAAYQIIQSETAIGSGGLLGKGFGQGTQTQLKFLPVQESDFILSVIGEEFGFIIILLIFLTLTSLILRSLKLAYNSNDRFSSLTIIGMITTFLAQFYVNAAMTVGLIPVKGLPFPFVSYGGSFLLSCFIMVGIIINFGVKKPE
jgi:rod shape determining protein RodA